MGPLFSLALVAVASIALFGIVFLAMRMFLNTAGALRRACGFVMGTGIGAALSVGIVALVIGTGVTLTTKTQVVAYLATVGFGALSGGTTLSYFVSRKFR